jgi:hypothetical protein
MIYECMKLKKIELEGKLKEADEVRADRLAESERALIKAAKRRKEAEEIGDEAVVEKIDEQRAQETHSENFDSAETLKSLDNREVSVIRALGRVETEVQTSSMNGRTQDIFLHEMNHAIENLNSVRLQVELDDSLKKLESLNLVKNSGTYNKWTLTTKGYKLYDLLNS